jgi:hypothetical protein
MTNTSMTDDSMIDDSPTDMTPTGDDFIERFEQGAISGENFHHRDHVYLAFGYLNRYPVLQALEKFSNAVKAFAAAHGKSQLYHETITFAYLFLINERMARSKTAGWAEFAECNPDLMIWKDGSLSGYYHEATLQSELARKVFLLPDKISR